METASKSVRVAAVQNCPVFLDLNQSIDKACSLIAEAGAGGASLVVFPEAFISAYPDWVWLLPPSQKKEINELYRELFESAVSLGDATCLKLGKAARKAGVYVTVGVNERNSEASHASLYNSLLYFNPDGELMGVHRKLIPTGGERLMWGQGQGDTMVSFDTKIGRLGGLICWENFMPLARNAMYDAGVQIYVAPTWDSSESWQTAMRHIAREGGMFVVSCAPCMHIDDVPDRLEYKKLYAEGKEWINKGKSCIVDPSGKYLAEPVEAKKTIIFADLDFSLIPEQKWLFDVSGHYSRPDVFEFGVK